MPGPVERLESAPCYEDLDLSREDRIEVERQKFLLRGAFADRLYTENPRNKVIIEELRLRVRKICEGEGTVEEFLNFNAEKFEDPEYAFLAQKHPGLNVTGWGVLLAELDPLRFGRKINRDVGRRMNWKPARG